MPDNKQIDPLLLRAIQGPLSRNPPTRGAGLDPTTMRTLGLNQPIFMGGKGRAGFNPSQIAPYRPTAAPLPPGMGDQPVIDNLPNLVTPEKGRNIPAERNPAIAPYLKLLKEQNIPHTVRISNAHQTAYIFYGPEGNKKVFTLRVPHPDKPHIGRPRPQDDPKAFIDTAGLERLPYKGMDEGALRNSAGGSFSDINNVKDAILWQMGRLTPVGSEPFSNSPDYIPKPPKGPAFHPKQEKNPQRHFMPQMLHKDKQMRTETIMGGDPSSPLSAQSLNQRFNLVNPKDLGDYGPKTYDPMKDPNYLELLSLIKRFSGPKGNDR